MSREKQILVHGIWILAFVAVNRIQPYRSGKGFGVAGKVPSSYSSGKLKHDRKLPSRPLLWDMVFSVNMVQGQN